MSKAAASAKVVFDAWPLSSHSHAVKLALACGRGCCSARKFFDQGVACETEHADGEREAGRQGGRGGRENVRVTGRCLRCLPTTHSMRREERER
eukprot:747785-Hanusia_phi.AAC.1